MKLSWSRHISSCRVSALTLSVLLALSVLVVRLSPPIAPRNEKKRGKSKRASMSADLQSLEDTAVQQHGGTKRKFRLTENENGTCGRRFFSLMPPAGES